MHSDESYTATVRAALKKAKKKPSKSQAKQPIQSETTRRRTSELVRREGAGRCVSASWSLVSTLDGAVVLALRAGCQGGQGGGGRAGEKRPRRAPGRPASPRRKATVQRNPPAEVRSEAAPLGATLGATRLGSPAAGFRRATLVGSHAHAIGS